jgi:hypothetical protein
MVCRTVPCTLLFVRPMLYYVAISSISPLHYLLCHSVHCIMLFSVVAFCMVPQHCIPLNTTVLTSFVVLFPYILYGSASLHTTSYYVLCQSLHLVLHCNITCPVVLCTVLCPVSVSCIALQYYMLLHIFSIVLFLRPVFHAVASRTLLQHYMLCCTISFVVLFLFPVLLFQSLLPCNITCYILLCPVLFCSYVVCYAVWNSIVVSNIITRGYGIAQNSCLGTPQSRTTSGIFKSF